MQDSIQLLKQYGDGDDGADGDDGGDIIEMHKNTFPSLIVAFSIMHKFNDITITRTIVAMITYPNRKHRDTSSHNTSL